MWHQSSKLNARFDAGIKNSKLGPSYYIEISKLLVKYSFFTTNNDILNKCC